MESLIKSSEQRELAQKRMDMIKAYAEDKHNQQMEFKTYINQQSQMHGALQQLQQTLDQKKGRKFYSRGNYISSVSQQSLPTVGQARVSPLRVPSMSQ